MNAYLLLLQFVEATYIIHWVNFLIPDKFPNCSVQQPLLLKHTKRAVALPIAILCERHFCALQAPFLHAVICRLNAYFFVNFILLM